MVAIALWLTLHAAGVDAALDWCGPRPAVAHPPDSNRERLGRPGRDRARRPRACRDRREIFGAGRPCAPQRLPVWDWASRNLSAASARLLSPADWFELAVGPWSTYLVLPLFAFSAVGVPLSIDLSLSWSVGRPGRGGPRACGRQAARHLARLVARRPSEARDCPGRCHPGSVPGSSRPLRGRRYRGSAHGGLGVSGQCGLPPSPRLASWLARSWPAPLVRWCSSSARVDRLDRRRFALVVDDEVDGLPGTAGVFRRAAA